MYAKRAFNVLDRPADATVPVKVTYTPMLAECHEPQVGSVGLRVDGRKRAV